jgi:hypothetical protein
MGRWSAPLAPRFVSWLQDSSRRSLAGCWVRHGSACEPPSAATATQRLSLDAIPPNRSIEFCSGTFSEDARVSFVVAGVGKPSAPTRGLRQRHVVVRFEFSSRLRRRRSRDAGPSPRHRGRCPRACGTTGTEWSSCGVSGMRRRQWTRRPDRSTKVVDSCLSPRGTDGLVPRGGLGDVRCEPIEIPTAFASFDDYWQPFLGGTGPAPSYVASLDADRRELLRGSLTRRCGDGPSGAITLTARAWAVRERCIDARNCLTTACS